MKFSMLESLLLFFVITNLHDIGYVAAQPPVADSGVDLGTAMQLYIQAFQQIMPCGYPPANIPVLAPYTVPLETLNSGNSYYQVEGNVSNLVITGLNNFYFINFNFNTTTNRITYDVMFTNVQIAGQYNINFWAELGGFPVSMKGKGLLDMRIVDYRAIGDFVMGASAQNPNSLAITDFNIQFTMGDFKASNWNYNWDIAANNFVNTWLRAFVLMYVEQIQPRVTEMYNNYVLPTLNQALDGVSTQQLIDQLLQVAGEFNAANCTL